MITQCIAKDRRGRLTGNVKSVNTSLDVGEGALLQLVDSVVVEIQSPQGCCILESISRNLTDVVVVQLKMDKPLEIIKNSIVYYTYVIETDIYHFKSLQTIEAISG